jgi:threonine dehydrogenase-like Zn-dependent dehydrogenase
MGLGAIDYAIHCDRKPGLLVVTDIDNERLERAASIYTVEEARANGVELLYINTEEPGKDTEYLKSLTPGGEGFNDVHVYAPVRQVVEQADRILAHDGCLNFFAGPTDPGFSAEFNFYNVHYAATHVVGTSGGNTDDMVESLRMMEQGKVNPSTMITHVGGLDSVRNTTLNLPEIPGGKKLVYNHVSMPLVALDELQTMDGEMYQGLAEIVARHNGMWSPEAEDYLLANAPRI